MSAIARALVMDEHALDSIIPAFRRRWKQEQFISIVVCDDHHVGNCQDSMETRIINTAAEIVNLIGDCEGRDPTKSLESSEVQKLTVDFSSRQPSWEP